MDLTRLLSVCRPPSVELLIRSDDTCVVTCCGEFDRGNSVPLEDALETAAQRGESIVLDLACVDFVDAHVAEFLVRLRDANAGRGTAISLIGCGGQPGRMLDAVGFADEAPSLPGETDVSFQLLAPAEPWASGSPRVEASAATPSKSSA